MVELYEDLGSLALLPSGIRNRDRYGENSKIEFVTDAGNVFDNLTNADNSITFYILRYKKNEIAIIKAIEKWSQGFEIEFEFMPYFKDDIYNKDPKIDLYRYFTVAKSKSGFMKNLSKIMTMIHKVYDIKSKDITNNIDFMTLLPDENKIALQNKRNKIHNNIYGFEYNGKNVPSNHSRKRIYGKIHGNFSKPTDEYYQNQLKVRLKKYLDSKLPDLSIFEKMKDIKEVINNIKSLKIKNYEYSVTNWHPYNINLQDLVNGKDIFIDYDPDFHYYRQSSGINIPKKIKVKIILDNNGLNVENIYGMDEDDNIKPISDYTFMPIVNESKKTVKPILKESIDEPYKPKDDNTMPKITQKRVKLLTLRDVNRLKEIRNNKRKEIARDSIFIPFLYGPQEQEQGGGLGGL